MSSRNIARALAALILSALLVACGGGGSGSGGATPPVTPPVQGPPPPPQLKYPIPSGLWSAPPGSTPGTGNYVYLQSDNGDYVGGGRTYSYTNADTLMTLSTKDLEIDVGLQGNQNWSGSFLLPGAAANLQAGYFQDLTRTPFADHAVGGVEWNGEGRGCNTIKGWVVIDKIELAAGVMTALDLRFEQRCEGGTTALHGQIHWTKADAASGPVAGPRPIPLDLWRPAPGTAPATGNYLYLESGQGDYIGLGRTYTYTQANAILTLAASDAHLGVRVAGDQNWNGDFQGMAALPQLAVGYYGELKRYPFNNPLLGGLSWSGEGRGCNSLSGWFAVDKVSYNGTMLTALDLRFEQSCDGSTSPLRGQLHWTINDTSSAPGPQSPPPAGLWKPAPSFVPPVGNYVYLVNDLGDSSGSRTELLTPNNTSISVVANLTAALRISAGGWTGDFVGMNTLSQLQPGYYGDLQRYPFHNPARGGMNWSGNGTGCNTLTGWFVVERASYALGALTAIDLRFEQHCDGFAPALHGVIHWAK